jgi:molybdate/tungstate transport system substrate-binding protein
MLTFGVQRVVGAGALLAISCAGLAVAGCGSSAPASHASTPDGTASVAYASSLQNLNEKVAGPAFAKTSGFKYSGRGGESGALEMEIASNEIAPDVFESVGGDNITPLEPKFTKWYIQYAGNAMVVAYSSSSKYASQFAAIAGGKKPLRDMFALMEKPGFKLGRTDPNLDPQGRSFIEMLELAQMYYHLPANTVTKILGGPLASADSPEIFAESSLDATLESGQLDAASAYLTQAIELHLHYIRLPVPINLSSAALASQYAKAHITITAHGVKTPKSGKPLVLDLTTIGKPTKAGTAFIKYTLSAAGRAQYKAAGFALLKPTVFGSMTAVPAAIRSELGG